MLRSSIRRLLRAPSTVRSVLRRSVAEVVERRTGALQAEASELRSEVASLEDQIEQVLGRLQETAERIAALERES